ncbi:UNVERIFIED_CONTAM: hypothetical protein GTU68_059564 [Idotea baltica]|nr:hypothetical protein [Idotea baltica]
MFDCGEGCATGLKKSDLQSVEHLCFSHFHMDHISGFDSFFRNNFNRETGVVNVWGPEQTIEVMHHRFRGFSWNLHHDQPGEWEVHEISEKEIRAARFITSEAFETAHPLPSRKKKDVIISAPGYSVEARILNHGTTPSIGYKIKECDRSNVDMTKLTAHGLRPGPWLKPVTSASTADSETIDLDGNPHVVGDLRKEFLIRSPGESLAYLTDFCLTDADRPEIIDWIRGTDTLVCEAQYRHSDLDLALKNHHSTTQLVGEIARDAEVGELVLQHISRRYSASEWLEMLTEAQAVFSNTRFPEHWNLG